MVDLKKEKIKIERRIITKGLENLVHKRTSYERLNQVLCHLFKVDDIFVSECEAEAEKLNCDYNLEFAITKPIIGGVFDIYYLPLKRKGSYGEEIYITEVGYTFDM